MPPNRNLPVGQHESQPSEQRIKQMKTSRVRARPPFDLIEAFCNPNFEPSIMLSPQLREDVGLPPHFLPPITTLRGFMTMKDQRYLDSAREIEQLIADPHRDNPVAITAEEEDLMSEITLEDVDKMLDGIAPASPGIEQTANQHWNDSMTTMSQGRELTGEVILEDTDKILDSTVPENPDLEQNSIEDLTSNLSSLSETLSEPPSTPESDRVPRRVRYAAASSPEPGLARRTRSMTATAISASASPAPLSGPSEIDEPSSWETACQADKHMSHLKDAGKGWLEITDTWNRETGQKKTKQEVKARWELINGTIGRWTGVDVSF
ncbi:hypothetical protein N7541_007273 [Penicillium brevicompactum]|uniref:Uncharacterized protein n=1 Tax=Penicillium brevicompactum TaxID=5074 RepID=A0A9W9QWU3_PENBR|nr:hypothetical protein N7541_007273 [Penicillium brevicompactum]